MYRNYTNLTTFFLTLSFLMLSFSSFAKEKTFKLKKGNVYVVTMTTNEGEIVFQLLNSTPIHRDNFVKLAGNNFYDNVLFHRVINDFMIQAGDAKTRDRSPEARKDYGDEEPPYKPPYTLKAEIDPLILHYRGALGAARESLNNPEKESSPSQFYIVQCPVSEKLKEKIDKAVKSGKMSKEQSEEYLKRGGTPHLDGGYTVFGSVLRGMDVVDLIANVKRDKKDCPEKDIEILETKVKQINKKKLYKYE